MDISEKIPLFTNPTESITGLSIADLNRYLPAIQTAKEIVMTADDMKEGIFLADCLAGLAKLPSKSIDLIIVEPPDQILAINTEKKHNTLQDFFKWNENWLKEAQRILKTAGSIYLLCGWHYSGMFHSLLSNIFIVQTRITWHDERAGNQPKVRTWDNCMSDIWFATKSNEFLFNQRTVSTGNIKSIKDETHFSNLWSDIFNHIPDKKNIEAEKHKALINRILDASSFKLNYVVDPFMRGGDVGVIAKLRGRRFIGFDIDQDNLLIAMKRIDQT